MGKEIIARRFELTESTALPTGEMLIERRTVTDGWSRMAGELIVVENGVTRTFHLEHWLYSGLELKRLPKSVGFPEIDLYRSLDGAAYGPEAKRLIAVGRKRCFLALFYDPEQELHHNPDNTINPARNEILRRKVMRLLSPEGLGSVRAGDPEMNTARKVR